MLFAKFVEAISRPALQVAEGAAKQIEREFQREFDRAGQRLADRAVAESSRRIVGLFGAIAPPPEDATGTGSRVARGLFAPPTDDDEY